MSTKTSLALVAALLLFLSGTLRVALRSGQDADPLGSPTPETSDVPADEFARRQQLIEENEGMKRLRREREGLAVAPNASPAAGPPAHHGSVAVVVADADGGPLADTRIRLRRAGSPTGHPFSGPGGKKIDLVTDAAGKALSPKLEPGRYGLSLRFPGGYITKVVDVAPGRPVEVHVAAPQGVTVAGAVRRFGGDPLAGASLLLWESALAFECVSAEDGGFQFENVPAGDYRLRISANVGRPDSFVAFRELEVLPDGGRSLDIAVRVPNLHGTILDDATGLPVSGARVTVKSHELVKWTVSDGNGRWEFLDLYPAGAVELTVVRDGYRTGRVPRVAIRPGEAREIPVRLEPEEGK